MFSGESHTLSVIADDLAARGVAPDADAAHCFRLRQVLDVVAIPPLEPAVAEHFDDEIRGTLTLVAISEKEPRLLLAEVLKHPVLDADLGLHTHVSVQRAPLELARPALSIP